jgi:hypothetical protein
MAHKVIVPQKKIMSRSFLNSGTLIVIFPVLRIRDVYLGSRIRIFSIPDPGSEFFSSRIRIKEFKYFNTKNCLYSKLSEI